MKEKWINKFREELKEDLENAYDGDYDAWIEVVRDCPSATIDQLRAKASEELSEEEVEECYEKALLKIKN